TGPFSRVQPTGFPTLTLAQPITGSGGMELRGMVILPVANSYEGSTTVKGEVFFPSDSSFGIGSGLYLSGVQVGNGTILHPQGQWITNRIVDISGIADCFIDTGGNDAVWNGEIT